MIRLPFPAKVLGGLVGAIAATSTCGLDILIGTVEGLVTLDGNGLAGFPVRVVDSRNGNQTLTTGPDGRYTYQAEYGGDQTDYTVTVSIEPPPDSECDPESDTLTAENFEGGGGSLMVDFRCTSRASSVSITPPRTLAIQGQGGTVTFGATVLKNDGSPLTGRPATWSLVTPNPNITVGADGIFIVAPATPAGDILIQVEVDDKTATAAIRVGEVPGNLFFVSTVGGVSQVYRKSLDDLSLPIQLWANPAGTISGIKWFDGTLFYAQGNDIWSATDDGAVRVNLTNNAAGLNATPAVNPTTGAIMFSRFENSLQNIFQMDPDGTNLVQITIGAGSKGFPAVSPNGLNLAWAQDVGGGNFEIFTSSSTGANPVRYTDFAGADLYPVWTDDISLTWSRDLGSGNSEIRRADWPNGANQVLLSTAGGLNTQPARPCFVSPTFLPALREVEEGVSGGIRWAYMLDRDKLAPPVRLSTSFASLSPVTSFALDCPP